ncbi:MAG: amidase [Rubripirellula sp.]|jgi:amidase/6-aminohexanoate-cyclic-dimer hydrolase
MTSKTTGVPTASDDLDIADGSGRSDDITRRRFMGRLSKQAGVGMLASGCILPTADSTNGQESTSSMPHNEYAKYDAMSLAALVRTGEASAEELLKAAIQRLEMVDPQINAIAGRMYDEARTAIRHGLPVGPFTGVPLPVKDISFPMNGVPSEYGSKLFADRISKRDSTAVERLRRAGFVPFARTRVPELGILPTTESTHGGMTRNPFALDHTAGGSSGGSAAAVAAEIAPIATASDGGGSIRIPAACCGLFGLKPTRARVPVGPDGFEAWGGLAVLHAVTRSVRDSAAMLDVMSGTAAGDPYAAPHHDGSFLQQVTHKPGKLRIALVKTMHPTTHVDPECLQALQESAALCDSLGHRVEETTDDFNRQFSFQELRQAHGLTVLVAVRRRVLSRLKELGRELRDDDLEPVTRFYHEYAEQYTAVELEDARTAFFRAARQMSEFQSRYDVIMTPTLAIPPVKHGKICLTGTAQQVLDGLLEFIPCTQMANWTGQPAMSIPLHQSKSGLPIGTHFMGKFGDEATLFRLAGQLEKVRPWDAQRPRLDVTKAD